MGQKKLVDLFNATKDEVTDVVLSDVIPQVTENIASTVFDEGMSVLVSGAVGAIMPRVHGVWLSYKQNRFERNVTQLLLSFERNQEYILNQLEKLNEDIQKKFSKEYMEFLLDNIVDEPQLQKVEYNINGYLHLLSVEDANEDVVLMFFKTLSQLNEIDLRVLRLYSNKSEENWLTLLQSTGIDNEQFRFIKEKLERLGLLQSKNETIREDNLKAIVDYIKCLQKELKKPSGKPIKDPKTKKESTSDTYSITKLGNRYLSIIEPVGI